MKKLYLALLLCLCLGLAGCDVVTGGVARPKGPKEMTVTLPGNPTTGFEWNYLISDEAILKEKSQAFTPDAAQEDAAGAGGQYQWTFEAVGEGTANVVFAYARSFEEVEPAEMMTYILTVDENGHLKLDDSYGTMNAPPVFGPDV